MAYKAAPLPHEWMITSIIGFFVALLLVYPSISKKWGAAFMLFFFVVFMASMVSITTASTEPEHIAALSHKRK